MSNMKKKTLLATLISLFVAYGIVNLILFLCVPGERLSVSSFWIAWSFTFPLNIITTILATLYCTRSSATAIAKVPVVFTVQYVFTGIYLVAGFIFMMFNNDISVAVWVIEAIITGAYILVALFVFLGLSHISGNIENTRKKVFYIRSLQADIDTCASQVTDNDIKAQLQALSEKIRFSDPMSHESLKPCEDKIQELVSEIVTNVSVGKLEPVAELISKTSIQLESRNNKCKILK